MDSKHLPILACLALRTDGKKVDAETKRELKSLIGEDRSATTDRSTETGYLRVVRTEWRILKNKVKTRPKMLEGKWRKVLEQESIPWLRGGVDLGRNAEGTKGADHHERNARGVMQEGKISLWTVNQDYPQLVHSAKPKGE